MGRHLYKYFTKNLDVELDEANFVAWNVLPDIAPSLLKLSHFKKDIYDLVMERAENLSKHGAEMSVKEYSKQLGILCHFMADFFCYAHADYFDGTKLGHAKYEIEMQLYGYRRKEMLSAVDLLVNAAEMDKSLALYEQINLLHEQYRSIAPSYGVDIVYTLTACVGIIRSITEEKFATAQK